MGDGKFLQVNFINTFMFTQKKNTKRSGETPLFCCVLCGGVVVVWWCGGVVVVWRPNHI